MPKHTWAEFVRDPQSTDGMCIQHRDGVAWHDAEVPSRARHCCWAQTQIIGDYDTVNRCPCGAYQVPAMGRRWSHKNSREGARRTWIQRWYYQRTEG